MQNWTSLDTDQVMKHYWGLRSRRNHACLQRIRLLNCNAHRRWQNVMLWCLRYRKKQALTLLLATLKRRKYRPPRYVVSDSLQFIARHYLFEVSNPNPIAVDAIWLLTCKFIDGASDQEQNFTVPQHLVYLVLKHSDDSRVLSFYWLLSLNRAVLHADTMLQFLDRLLDMGRINMSMKLLNTVANTGFDLSFDQVQMACVKLLRARFDTAAEYTVRSNILSQILEMGVRPKIHMFNTILLNAGEGGDFANAWQMYGMAKETALTPDSVTYGALTPDSVTYGVLLKGAILSDNLSNVELVVREIQRNEKVLQDLRLVSDVLRAISLISPGDEFGAMLDFYKIYCDLGPLQELSLCGDETRAPPGANCRGVWPTSYILTHMILAYLKRHQGSRGLLHTYDLYYQRVKDDHPLIAPLAQEDFVANAFIMAFGKKIDTLQHCTTVVKHMLEFSSPKFATSDTVAYAGPTVQTWSILVAAYFSNHQRRAAEKVLDMMHERGMRGDKVTWNTLIKGYAHLQDVNATVETVKGMEAAGFEADAYTTTALGKLWIRDRLMKALDTSVEEQSLNGEPITGRLQPLDSKEQHEAKRAFEWESRMLTAEKKVKRYLMADTDSKDPGESLVATA